MGHNSRSFIPLIFFLLMLFPSTGLTQTDPSEKKKEEKNRKEIEKEKMEEENIARWDFGINFGAYFANKYTANYYNGSDENVNKISWVMETKYWYDEIKQILHADSVILREYPTNMNYHVALMGGLFFRYNFTRRWGLFLEFNYTQLTTDAQFTLEVDPYDQPNLPELFLYGIHGREQRVNFDLGAHCRFPVYKKKMNLFLQAGLNINYTGVMKSYINIEDHEYSIINIYGDQYYVPNSNIQGYQTTQGGFGYGPYAGGGMGFTFTRQIGMELGGYLNYITVDLEGYKQFKPNGGAYIRFLLNNLISREEE